MRDPYTVLGIGKTADEKQIKSAFRQLAMKYHPDHNKDDKSAQAKFAELNQAYEILGDKNKRAQFDRGEIDAEGKPRFAAGAGGGFGGAGFGGGGFGGGRASGFEHFDFGGMGGGARRGAAGGFDFSDIFGEAFGGMGGARARAGRAQPRKGADIAAALNVSLAQIIGAEKVEAAFSDGKRLKIKLPDYLEDGQTIRLKGQGRQAPGGINGDALITVHFRPDSRFRLDGRDVHMDLPISLKTAVLGGRQTVQTLDGAVALAIPAWVNAGKALRLQGRGLPLKTGGRGALYVHLQIELPAEKDSRLTELMQTYAD